MPEVASVEFVVAGRGAGAVQGDPGRRRAARTSRSTSSRTRCTRASNVRLTRPGDLGRRDDALREDPIVRNVLNIDALVDRVLTVTDVRADRRAS